MESRSKVNSGVPPPPPFFFPIFRGGSAAPGNWLPSCGCTRRLPETSIERPSPASSVKEEKTSKANQLTTAETHQEPLIEIKREHDTPSRPQNCSSCAKTLMQRAVESGCPLQPLLPRHITCNNINIISENRRNFITTF